MAWLYVRTNIVDSVVTVQVTTGGKEAFYHRHVDKISVAQYLINTDGSL